MDGVLYLYYIIILDVYFDTLEIISKIAIIYLPVGKLPIDNTPSLH